MNITFTMKAFLLVCICSLMSACSATSRIEVPLQPDPVSLKPDTVLTQVLSYGTTSFRGTATMQLAKSKSNGQQYNAMYVDHTRNLAVLIKTAPITDELEVLVLQTQQMLANSGFATGYPQTIIWLNNQANFFEIERDGLRAYQWIGLVNGQGIALTCGGSKADSLTNSLLCNDIAATVMMAPLVPSNGNN
jgi:hypothetical protein